MAKVPYIGAPTFIDGYTTLEYIESTGTQYINTGYKPNNNTRVVIEASVTLPAAGQSDVCLFGAYHSGSDRYRFSLTVGSTGRVGYAYAYGGYTITDISDNTKYVFDCNKAVCTVNGVTKDVPSASFENPYDLLLFTYRSTASNFFAKMKLYSCKIYDNGTLVLDFVPCKNGDDVGLLDLLTNQLYSNDGTGTFIAGPTTGNIGGTVTVERARKIIQPYIGIGGVARKVRKAYIGDENGKARLVYAKTYKVRITGSSWHDGGDWGNHMAVVDINGKLYREGLVDLEVESGAAVNIELRHNSGCPASYKRVYLNGVLVFSGTKSGSEYYKYYIKGDTVINFVDGGDRDNGWAAGEVHITET